MINLFIIVFLFINFAYKYMNNLKRFEDMKRLFFIIAALFMILQVAPAFAQQQNPDEEKSPEELAIEMAESLEKDLNLDATQMFLVDSIFRHNYVAMVDDINNMRKMGVQDPRNYKAVSDQWTEKNLAALKKVLTEQQYIRYLKMIGKGKEYKKDKDGNYVLKKKKKS